MNRQGRSRSVSFLGVVAACCAGSLLPCPARGWEPTKPIELVIPAGTGGGADQMARLVAAIAEKHKLSPQPLIAVNKSGGAGAEGFLHVKGKNSNMMDVLYVIPFGLVGYVFKKLDYPLAPLVLALVLGDLAESAFRQSLIMSQGTLLVFFRRPIAAVITTAAIVLFVYPLMADWPHRSRPASPPVTPISSDSTS